MKGRIIFIVTGLIFGFMLFWKLNLGLTRYFDADEFAYLHWAHNVFAGRLPYRDFLLYVPSGFLYVLAPLYWVYDGASILIASRVFAWVVYVGMCITLGVFMPRTYFFLPGILLSFLPIPADKLLEVRPDNLAMLVSLIGLLCQTRKKFFWAGVLYGCSLLILPKTLPMIVVAGLVSRSIPLLVGIIVPLAMFGLSIVPLWDTALYSLTKLPFEVNRLGELYPMQKDLFFYPNELYYGMPGWNIGLITNHAVWLIGLFIGIHRVLSGDFLMAGSMMAYIVAFMYGYQLRHAQYLIPIAVFVALFAADSLRKRGVIAVIGVIGVIVPVFLVSTKPKLAWINTEDVNRLTRIVSTVPRDAKVFDLVGSTIYFTDPYYVSAVPFGEWKQFLSRPLPVLHLPQDTFIYKDLLGRVDRLVPGGVKMYHYLQ